VPSPHTLTRTQIVCFVLDVQYESYCKDTPCVSLPCLQSNFLRSFTCALDQFDPSSKRTILIHSRFVVLLKSFSITKSIFPAKI